uniref:Uncharacterized protein n=1 Tax=Megaselia scalaris TaxID=36166 RepID=T1H4Z9_MEGSC
MLCQQSKVSIAPDPSSYLLKSFELHKVDDTEALQQNQLLLQIPTPTTKSSISQILWQFGRILPAFGTFCANRGSTGKRSQNKIHYLHTEAPRNRTNITLGSHRGS